MKIMFVGDKSWYGFGDKMFEVNKGKWLEEEEISMGEDLEGMEGMKGKNM